MIATRRKVAAGLLGGVLLMGATTAPASASPGGPILSGTYDTVATYGTATVHEVVKITSDCPRCNAVGALRTGTATMTWNGVGWQAVAASGCGPLTTVYTPTGNLDGVVQNFTILGTYLTPEVCGITGPTVGTGVRTGD